MGIKIGILVVYFAIMVGIGLYCRKHATDVKGFVLGGRSVGPWLTAFAYGTSYFSAVVFVGYAGQFGWKYGIASTWIGLGNAIIGSLLAWVILGRRTRIMTQHLDSATMPEFFGSRFDSKSLKIGASALIFIFLIPYTASLYNGLSRLFAMAFDIDFTICVIVMAVLTGIYVIAGGYMATAINDFIQGIIMLFGICAVIAAVLQSKGGFTEAMHSLAEVQDPEATTMNGAFASFLGPDPLNLLGVVVLTSLGTWGLPQMVQKFYAINSEECDQKGYDNFHIVCCCSIWRMLFPGRIWQTVFRSGGCCGKWIRFYYPNDAVWTFGCADRSCGSAGIIGIHVHAFFAGYCIKLDADAGFHQ